MSSLSKIQIDGVMTMASYMWQSCTEALVKDDIADSLHLMCPQWKTPELGRDINHQMAGVVSDTGLCLSDQSNLSERWREAVRNIKASGKMFDLWATFKGDRRADFRGYVISECQMPKEEYEFMVQEVGDLFLGWEIGEWDGLYARDVVQHWADDEKPTSRKEGHATFMRYIRNLHEMLYSDTNALCGMPYAHYFNELPVRMVGAETAQGLLNAQLYISSLRGACRQYGMHFKLISSIFDRWGHTDFVSSLDPNHPQKHGQRVGPYEGHTLGLLQALWITGYLAGAAIIGLEGAFYTGEVVAGRRQLSPMGKAMHELTRWSRDPHPRGEPIRPLAFMLDYHAGWAPPRHYYSSTAECVVWHGVPYGPSDYAMDRAYDCFYPGYIDSGFYRDERGFITPTPCGDVADILLTDAALQDMQAYPVIWLLTDESPTADLLDRMRAYAVSGGHLILSCTPMVEAAQAWFGLEMIEGTTEGIASIQVTEQRTLREAYYQVRVPEALPPDWTHHVVSEKNDPLVISNEMGKGKVTFIMADHGLADEMTLPEGRLRDFGPGIPHNYELLHAVKAYAREAISEHMPLRIDDENVYYCVNQLDAREVLVCVYNPGWKPWEGEIKQGNKGARQFRELKGPWGGQDADRSGLIRLEANETKLFIFHIEDYAES